MSDRNAEAFNTFTANWVARVDSMNNSIIFLDGGIMSITIGGFLTTAPPALEAGSEQQIQQAWIFLAVSLACAVLVKFALVVSGAITLKKWEQNISDDRERQAILDSPRWIHIFAWLLAANSFVLYCWV